MNVRKVEFKIGRGELSAFGASSLWSLFPVITTLTFSGVTPLWSAAFTTLAAAAFFMITLTLGKRWGELKVREAWRPILLHTLLIAVAMYALQFIGINNTTAANAAILSQTEVFFAFIILSLLMKHESITMQQMIGAVCIFSGACLVLIPDLAAWQWGGLLIVISKILAPFGNRYSQMARTMVSAHTIMFVRSIIGSVFLFALAYAIEGPANAEAVRASLPFLVVNGFLLMGFSKVLWINGMHYIPITKGNAIAGMSPVLTMIASFLILGESIKSTQLLGLPAVFIGVLLLTGTARTQQS